MQNTSAPAKSLTKQQLFGYAMGDFGGCVTFTVMGYFLTPYDLEVAGMSATAIAAMFLLLKFWDALCNPMMGTLLDKSFARTRNPKGKFRPWLRRATPLLGICAVLVFTAPSFFVGSAQMLVAFVTYLLYEASYTMFNIPYGSLLSAMANTDEDRASLSSARGFGAMVGSMIPMLAFPVIIDAMADNPQLSYTAGIATCAVLGFIACMLCARFTTERTLPPSAGQDEADQIQFRDIISVFRKNRPFVALCLLGFANSVFLFITFTLSLYMYRDVLGNLTFMSVGSALSVGVNMCFLSCAPRLAKKLGLERFLRITLLISAAGYVLLFFIGQTALIYLIGVTLCASFAAMTTYMQWGMLGEVIDYNEYLLGKRTEGSIYGMFNFVRRIGQALGSSGAVFLLGVICYLPNADQQTEAVLTGIRALATLLPALFILVCWAALQFLWNITPETRAALAKHRQATN